MKKTVPFKKEIPFKSNVAEIVSISLEHDLKLENYVVRGNLIIGGSYKMNDISINTEEFKYNIPVNIEMNEKYILDHLEIDIEDFYYELLNNNTLSVDIEIGLNKLEEKIIEEKEEIAPVEFKNNNILDERNTMSDVKTLFDSFDESVETYATYRICIIKEGDNIDSILVEYGISREVLEQYNDLSDIKLGDKLIIPALENEKD